MDLVYLHTFREVARLGSYSKAADELGYAQSSITSQIQKLEQSYQTVLFERHGRGIRLTFAGETLLSYANRLLALYAESKEVIAAQDTGTMHIGTIESLAAYYLPPFLQQFRQTHPGIHIMLHTGNEPKLIEEVKAGNLDLAFLLDTLCTEQELETISLREEALHIIMPPGHPLQNQEVVGPRDLDGETLITTEDGCTYRAMLLRQLKATGTHVTLAYQFANLEAIKHCVVYGLGISLLPRIAVEAEVAHGKLVTVPFRNEPQESFFTQAIYRKKKWQPAAVQQFLAMMVRKM
ncbi:LysR family transcriptional regulator [Brevibacillus migulae]|uniref:LysR family transcriptional regulator n=1 Tax=Brevibacillus migulae TaxID=1644114 RepID=UPI00106E32DC|nr:LysR family transcriptional regulator [Brevibacillus migulae]